MKLIDIHHLEVWSGLPESNSDIAEVISRLIRATAPSLTKLEIPKGKSTFRGGWDGIVISETSTEFIPEGISLWEFGTEDKPAGKAEKDYLKRVKDTLGYTPSECTFVFVTSRPWEKFQEWQDVKLEDKIWKDIKIINGNILVEWLMFSPLQSLLIARSIGILLSASIEGAKSLYDTWSLGPGNLRLRPQIILAGREKQSIAIFEQLENSQDIICISGASKEEVIPFICATLLESDYQDREKLLSSCLIVDNTLDFKMLMVNPSPLLLIPRFTDLGLFRSAIWKGHHVILPLSPVEKYPGLDPIYLPKIDRDKIVQELQLLGMNEYKARTFSKETGRNITVIRRCLGFDGSKPSWAAEANRDLLLPVLLIGKWNENSPGDRWMVEHIVGEPYQQFVQKLEKWLTQPDAPLLRISAKWRLVSPLDAWAQLGCYLTGNLLERFAEAFLLVMKEIKPALSLKPELRHLSGFLSKPSEFTEFMRKGLCESMILTGLYGDNYQLPLQLPAQNWVDNHISLVLNNMDIKLWKSFDRIIPLLAEASPDSFLDSIEMFIRKGGAEFAHIFEEVPSPLFSGHYHTGILWALEKLVWLPGKLSRVTLILLEMNKLDPGVKIYNRPINSIANIYLSWHPQTEASLRERKQVILSVAARKPDLAWSFCERMLLLDRHTSGTARPKWRPYEPEFEYGSQEEIDDFIGFLYSTSLSLSHRNPYRLSFLLGKIEEVMPSSRMGLLNYLNDDRKNINDPGLELYSALRNLLYRINTYLRTEKLLGEGEVEQIKGAYVDFTPSDATSAYLWIFDDHYIKFPEGRPEESGHLEMFEYLRGRKKEALESIYKENSFSDFLALIQRVKEPQMFGETMAYLNLNDKEKLEVCCLLNSADAKSITAVSKYLYWSFFKNGFDFCQELYELAKWNLEEEARGRMLAALPVEPVIWQFLENEPLVTIDTYWKTCPIGFTNWSVESEKFQLTKFIGYNRFFSAMELLGREIERQLTSVITEVLIKLITLPAKDIIELDVHLVEEFIEVLQDRSDVDENELAKIEWNFISLLTNGYRAGSPKTLHKELSRSPEFFVEVLCWTTMAEDEDNFEVTFEGLDKEFAATRAKYGMKLLRSWKGVPGMRFNADQKPELDTFALKDWVNKVIELIKPHRRLEKANLRIGQIFASYPEGDDIWPPEAIAELIDTIDSEELNQNFCVTVSNKRSFSSRAPYDGGQREKNLAAYFRRFASKHNAKNPVTAGLLESLAKTYDARAIEEDNEASENDLED